MPLASGETAKIYQLYASYNSWFNAKLLKSLSGQNYSSYNDAERAAAGAILRQLNHIFVMDLVWLNRFNSALHAAGDADDCFDRLMAPPGSMGQILFLKIKDLEPERADLDAMIVRFAERLTDPRFEMSVSFRTLADDMTITRPLWALLLHFFNHQSLHRGEIIAHIERLGIDIGPTDILPLTAELL